MRSIPRVYARLKSCALEAQKLPHSTPITLNGF
uniref:Uncharacterized protein n=1 Tax=Anguilla anguilla TaxID=7936 RepID=A0A0E9UNP0_ANGAN